MKKKNDLLKKFSYRGSIWFSGMEIRHKTCIFRKYYDKTTKKTTIQHAVQFTDPYPPFRIKQTRWVDFCNFNDASILDEE